MSLDLNGYVDLVFAGRPVVQSLKDDLTKIAVVTSRHEYDLRQLTNGHDFHCALGASLRSELGARRAAHTWGSEVEMHLRLAFGDKDFKEFGSTQPSVHGFMRTRPTRSLT